MTAWITKGEKRTKQESSRKSNSWNIFRTGRRYQHTGSETLQIQRNRQQHTDLSLKSTVHQWRGIFKTTQREIICCPHRINIEDSWLHTFNMLGENNCHSRILYHSVKKDRIWYGLDLYEPQAQMLKVWLPSVELLGSGRSFKRDRAEPEEVGSLEKYNWRCYLGPYLSFHAYEFLDAVRWAALLPAMTVYLNTSPEPMGRTTMNWNLWIHDPT